MGKLITLYNNKGGVSKTTTLFNIAAYLANSGKKVLIADCDPQCNVTELFFASSNRANDPNEDLPGTSIYDAIRPRFQGETSQIDVSNINLVESEKYRKNLMLLRGDLEFSLAESYFAKAWNLAITDDVHEKNTYLALNNLLVDISNKYKFDYILCDVGPSTSYTTRFVVLACDGYFIPVIPDRFNNQAIKVLSIVLEKWIRKHGLTKANFEPFDMKCFEGSPLFLGAILQDFKFSVDRNALKSYEIWSSLIQNTIIKNLMTNKIPHSKMISSTDPFAVKFKFMGPLVSIAQTLGEPIFEIRKAHIDALCDPNSFDPSDSKKLNKQMEYMSHTWSYWENIIKQYKEELQKLIKLMNAPKEGAEE